MKSDVYMEDDVKLQIPTKPRNTEVQRSNLRNRKRVDYSELAN